jgi:hypothetical protein
MVRRPIAPLDLDLELDDNITRILDNNTTTWTLD